VVGEKGTFDGYAPLLALEPLQSYLILLRDK
jgi:hypothetical protein